MFDANSMPDGQHEQDENSRPKEQPEDDQDAAEATEKRANKSPHLEMRMDSPVARARAKVSPRVRAGQQDRRGVNQKEDPDANAQQEQAEVRVFREKLHSHRGMMKRCLNGRKQNDVASPNFKERRFAIADAFNGDYKSPLLVASSACKLVS
jgi:hypothetical protein